MTEDDTLLMKRFTELAHRAFRRDTGLYTDFLNRAEQEVLLRTAFDQNSAAFTLMGGYAAAERKVACFGMFAPEDAPSIAPVACICIAPCSQKFADQLSHRDFLGSVLALGLKREVLGDIIIHENCGYLFCLASIADYIIAELKQVKHTTVRCSLTAAPDFINQIPDPSQIVIASERLDAMVAAVYHLSRSESQQLFAKGMVSVNSRVCENTSATPAAGSIVSVRSFGRFLYDGIEQETRKGRLRVSVRIFS
ncbi:MAG: YlmH/Sll1252 family protein [Negativicutes bacterium]|nr:YlmH/Sll1252 family protein [Negativicutes bacterium]